MGALWCGSRAARRKWWTRGCYGSASDASSRRQNCAHAELGLRGPIVGTIHASKGREADTVHLMLPYTHSQTVSTRTKKRGSCLSARPAGARGC